MNYEKSYPVNVSVTYARRNLGDLVLRAHVGGEHFIVKKGGLPAVVIISLDEYEAFREWQEREGHLVKSEEAIQENGNFVEQNHFENGDGKSIYPEIDGPRKWTDVWG